MARSYAALAQGLARRTSIDEAKQAWADARVRSGLQATTPRLLTPPKGNVKLAKTNQWGLSLLPHRLAGVGNVCPYSTKGCRSVCLNTAGRGAARFVQEARSARTLLLVERPDAFATLLEKEIRDLPEGSALRLNVFSDLPWETIWPEIFEIRADMQFYDYTKWPIGVRDVPANYHLTYSASELWSDTDVADAVGDGNNVTVVLRLKRSEEIPAVWKGLTVVDGDKSDARYDDPDGVVVALRAKGAARKSNSKFIRKAA